MAVGAWRRATSRRSRSPCTGWARSGILGYDFFFGHVVQVDYAHQRVEVFPRESAEAVFAEREHHGARGERREGLPLVGRHRCGLVRPLRARYRLRPAGRARTVSAAPRERHRRALETLAPARAPATLRFLEGTLRIRRERAGARPRVRAASAQRPSRCKSRATTAPTRSTRRSTGSSARTCWRSSTAGSTTTTGGSVCAARPPPCRPPCADRLPAARARRLSRCRRAAARRRTRSAPAPCRAPSARGPRLVISSALACAPSRSTTSALTCSPRRASSEAITQASLIAGWAIELRLDLGRPDLEARRR